MSTQDERSFTVEIAGNHYTVWHIGDTIIATACRGRWPRSSMSIGDDWIERKLREHLASILD